MYVRSLCCQWDVGIMLFIYNCMLKYPLKFVWILLGSLVFLLVLTLQMYNSMLSAVTYHHLHILFELKSYISIFLPLTTMLNCTEVKAPWTNPLHYLWRCFPSLSSTLPYIPFKLRIHYVCIKWCNAILCLCQALWYWLVDIGQKRPQESKTISTQGDVLSAVMPSSVHCLSFLPLLFCLSFLVRVLLLYEGESNENFKSVIKIWNTAQLSCKLATVILMVWRVANRWQYNGGTQHDGATIV